jgi:hypothetical protein
VTRWDATIDGDALALNADARSLKVREGKGGMQALGPDDVADIEQTIDKEVLRTEPITFRSTNVSDGAGGARHVEGDLTIAGQTHPVTFDVTIGDDGAVTGRAVVKQSDYGIKQYSILFGALKVADEVTIEIDARPA